MQQDSSLLLLNKTPGPFHLKRFLKTIKTRKISTSSKSQLLLNLDQKVLYTLTLTRLYLYYQIKEFSMTKDYRRKKNTMINYHNNVIM